MPATVSSWLVGSIVLPQQQFTVDATVVAIPAGTYYLRHATAALSLVDVVATAIVAALGGTCTVTLQRSRLVRIAFNVARSITWGTATQLRDLLGFTGDLGSATPQTATNISALLWSPAFPGMPTTVVGTLGYELERQEVYTSDDGSEIQSDFHGEIVWQELQWDHIPVSRLRTAASVSVAAQGGTFHQFYRQCARLRRRFFHYEQVTEDSSDSGTAVTWPSGLGPYVVREGFNPQWYTRRVPSADVSSSLELPLHVVAEVA